MDLGAIISVSLGMDILFCAYLIQPRLEEALDFWATYFVVT